MTAVVFDGKVAAHEQEKLLQQQVARLGKPLKLVSVFFSEDKTGQLYTRLKGEAAERVGISFEKIECSFVDDVTLLQPRVREVCERADVTGMLIQKPSKIVFENQQINKAANEQINFQEWWKGLVEQIDSAKDVDCLSPANLQKVYDGTWKILPATVRAVLVILAQAAQDLKLKAQSNQISLRHLALGVEHKRVVVVGRSDIVGRPLATVLQQFGAQVDLAGSTTEDLAGLTRAADVVISSVGKEKLITADMIREGAVVIDVGEPKGDVDFAAVVKKASFITPVPGGVGPLTVISLLENVVELARQRLFDQADVEK